MPPLRAMLPPRRARVLAAALLAVATGSAQKPEPEPEPAVVVVNPGAETRCGLVRVSVPWPRGAQSEIAALRVADDVAPAVTLLRWPDGSVRLAQAHARVAVAPGEQRLPVAVAEAADGAGAAAGTAAWPALQVRVEDPWGQAYTAELDAGAWRPVADLSSPRVAVWRARRPLQRTAADGRPESLFAVRAWRVDLPAEHRAELTVALVNDPRAGEPVLGPARLRSFALSWEDPALRALPREREARGLPPPEPRAAGGFTQYLLGPSDALYLGDRTACTFRIDLARPPQDAADDRIAALRAAVERPLLALPALDWVRHSAAFGAHGGPAPRPGDGASDSAGDALVAGLRVLLPRQTGPFGAFGDRRDAAAQGTPRNGPCRLHNVLRWRSAALWRLAEAAALQQSLRPTPAARPRTPEATAALRQGLSQRAQRRPHGYSALDYEHFSVDLLFDWFWLSGDPVARWELRRAVAALPDLLGNLEFRTSRGEGWCLQAAVLGAVASADPELLDPVAARFHGAVLPELGTVRGEHWAIAQPPDARALGGDEPFDAAWQMAALVHGMHALHRQRPDAALRAAIVATGQALAGPGWVPEVGPKCFVAVRDPATYALPVGHRPDEGTAWMVASALALAAEQARAEVDRSSLWAPAEFIVGGSLERATRADTFGNVWFQVVLDRRPEFR